MDIADDFLRRNASDPSGEIEKMERLNAHGLVDLYLPDYAIEEVELANHMNRIPEYTMSDRINYKGESGDGELVSNKSSNLKKRHLTPRNQSFNVSKPTHLILEVYKFDKDSTDDCILKFLRKIESQMRLAKENFTPLEMAISVKGVAYIKFTETKAAYLFHKSILVEKKFDNLYSNIQLRWLPSILQIKDSKKCPLLIFINGKSGGGQGKELYEKKKIL